jgi:hypothetical protein
VSPDDEISREQFRRRLPAGRRVGGVFPLPDADARSRLLDLFGRGLDMQLSDRAAIVAETDGVQKLDPDDGWDDDDEWDEEG